MTPGQYFTAYVAPSGSPAITDFGGLAVAATTHPFRASMNQQAENTLAETCAWRVVNNRSAFGGSYSIEHLAGAKASFKFTGSSITWYTNIGPSYGLADLFVDGVLKARVNAYNATNGFRAAFSLAGLRSGRHTLQIGVRGAKGSSHGTGTNIAIDGFRVGRSIISSPTLTYTWQVVKTSLASGGAYIRSDLSGATTSFTFRGTRVDWYTVLGSSMGRAKVYIDGVLKASVDNYAATTQYGVSRSFSGLSDAVHTIKIVVLGTHRPAATASFIAIDRLVVF
jgi:bacillopeptidase F